MSQNGLVLAQALVGGSATMKGKLNLGIITREDILEFRGMI
jgi:hypothetical protein